MTDNEIIKALECCKKPLSENTCVECAFYKTGRCSINMLNATLDLINRQKTEIERLKHIHKGDEQLISSLNKCYKLAKSEAIKEFAEKLKERLTGIGRSTTYGNFEYGTIKSYELDSLVKEMTENCNGQK